MGNITVDRCLYSMPIQCTTYVRIINYYYSLYYTRTYNYRMKRETARRRIPSNGVKSSLGLISSLHFKIF
jgi:hypothetical protein